jgi:hypothetical protein
VTIGRGKQAQVLGEQEAGWARISLEAIEERKFSLAQNQTPIS